MDAYLKVQQDQLKVLDELDFFGTSGKADAICEKVMDAELAMKDKEISLNEFFQQLSSLATRYKFYSSSYSYLLLEIERRRKAELKLMSLRKDMLKVFEEAYGGKIFFVMYSILILLDELEERKSWSAQHGEYLPEVLCPFINVCLYQSATHLIFIIGFTLQTHCGYGIRIRQTTCSITRKYRQGKIM